MKLEAEGLASEVVGRAGTHVDLVIILDKGGYLYMTVIKGILVTNDTSLSVIGTNEGIQTVCEET